MKRAIFLDRDGTLNRDTAYLNDPAQLELLPGATTALRAFQAAGYLLVCVTNQSGIARGLITREQLQAIHRRLGELLRQEGVSLDACYYCPYHPEGTVEPFNRESSCRKPQPGMLRQAAKDLDINLAESWMIGDAGRDMEAGLNAGCATLWLMQEKTTLPDPGQAHAVAPDWPRAVETLLRLTAAGVNGQTAPQPLADLLPKPAAEIPASAPVSPEPGTTSETAQPSETPVAEVPTLEIPAPPTPAPPTPAPETPAPETPAPETPLFEAPVEEVPPLEIPGAEPTAAETPTLETPPSESPAPEAPAPVVQASATTATTEVPTPAGSSPAEEERPAAIPADPSATEVPPSPAAVVPETSDLRPVMETGAALVVAPLPGPPADPNPEAVIPPEQDPLDDDSFKACAGFGVVL